MRRSVSPRLSGLLGQRAVGLRGSATWSEALLWHRLRSSQLGVRFRRQMVIGRYIVDFAAPAAALVVEVDGGYHEGRAVADARRDRDLGRLGWRVLRLPVGFVERATDEAVALVRSALAG